MSFLDEVKKEDIELPAEDKLSRLTMLAREQLKFQEEIEYLQNRIRYAQENLDKVSEREIPELMHEIGAREIKLLDGHKLSIKPFYTGKITSPECYTWLEDHGYGEIVRINLTVSYRMSDDAQAHKVRQLLRDNNIEYEETQGVHHSTLKAWVKDTVETSQPIDRELFSVYTGFKTIIK